LIIIMGVKKKKEDGDSISENNLDEP